MQGARTLLNEVRKEASIAAKVGGIVFLGEGWDSDGGVFAAQRVVEKDEVGKAASDFCFRALESFEVGLGAVRENLGQMVEGSGILLSTLGTICIEIGCLRLLVEVTTQYIRGDHRRSRGGPWLKHNSEEKD